MSQDKLFSIREVNGDFELTVYKDLQDSTLEYHRELECNLEKVYELLTCVLDLNDPEHFLEIQPKSYSFDQIKRLLYDYKFKTPFHLALYEYKKNKPFNIEIKGKIHTLHEFIDRIHIGGMIDYNDPEYPTYIHPDRVGLFYIDTKEEYTSGIQTKKFKLYDWKA